MLSFILIQKRTKKMFVGRVLQRWLHVELGSMQAIKFGNNIWFLKKNKASNIDDGIYENFEKGGTDEDIL